MIHKFIVKATGEKVEAVRFISGAWMEQAEFLESAGYHCGWRCSGKPSRISYYWERVESVSWGPLGIYSGAMGFQACIGDWAVKLPDGRCEPHTNEWVESHYEPYVPQRVYDEFVESCIAKAREQSRKPYSKPEPEDLSRVVCTYEHHGETDEAVRFTEENRALCRGFIAGTHYDVAEAMVGATRVLVWAPCKDSKFWWTLHHASIGDWLVKAGPCVCRVTDDNFSKVYKRVEPEEPVPEPPDRIQWTGNNLTDIEQFCWKHFARFDIYLVRTAHELTGELGITDYENEPLALRPGEFLQKREGGGLCHGGFNFVPGTEPAAFDPKTPRSIVWTGDNLEEIELFLKGTSCEGLIAREGDLLLIGNPVARCLPSERFKPGDLIEYGDVRFMRDGAIR